MSYYDNNSDDRDEMMPGDEEERPEIPENLTPDHPEYEYFKSLFGGQNPTAFMQRAFRVVPDGKGGFKKIPLSPDEIEFFKKMFMGNGAQRNTGAPTTSGVSMGSPTPSQYPHYLFLNREYVIQFVNGVTSQGSDVTLYLEVVKNPLVTDFNYSILDAYEKLNDNQFLTYLISLYADLYLWDIGSVKMNVIQNANPMYKDEKIVIIIKASKACPEWINNLNPVDFVGYEITDAITPFKDIPTQIFQNVYVQKHLYQPVVRVDATFTVGSNTRIQFTSPAIDTYGIYNQLVLPTIIEAVEIFYPAIAITSLYSRSTLNSVHIAYQTRIQNNLLEVIAYVSPAYVIDHGNRAFGFIPLNDDLFAISQQPIDDWDPEIIDGSDHGSIMKMLNGFYSSQDSQVFNVAIKSLGNFDVYNNIYNANACNSVLFLFGHLPSETLFRNWITEGDRCRVFDCQMYESAYPFIRRYMAPVSEVFIPRNPEETGVDNIYYKVYGFFEMDIVAVNKNGIDTFADVIELIKLEIVRYLKFPHEDFKDMTENPKFMLSEVWADGNIVRMIICKCGPLSDFASSDYVKDVIKKIKEINGEPAQPARTTSSWKKPFGNRNPK